MKRLLVISTLLAGFLTTTYALTQRSLGAIVDHPQPISTPSNPYEQIAADHNAMLGTILDQLKIRKHEDQAALRHRANDIMVRVLREYFQRTQPSNRTSPQAFEASLREASINLLQGRPPKFDPIRQCGPAAVKACQELAQIIGSASSAREADERIHSFESRLLIGKDEKDYKNVAPVLLFAAVERASLKFWDAHIGATGGGTASFLTVKGVAAADGAGAVIGAFAGGLGAGPGAVAGSVGAFISSWF